MIKKMIVKTDGRNYVGRIKEHRAYTVYDRKGRSEKSKRFDKYYYEAQYNGIPEKEILNYIQERFLFEAEDIIDDSITSEECYELYENFLKRRKAREKRYREKLFMGDWNYFVTFTYDDEKETAESFEKRLIIAFNNLAKRKGWKVIGGWERGELHGRSHFHAFVKVPEGQMVGELVTRSRYSYKKNRWEAYTDNTYFLERFGISDWIKVTKEELVNGNLASYLVKYVIKSGRRLFYSRGLPNEVEMDIDTENDVVMTYFNYGMRYLLPQVKFFGEGIFGKLFDFSKLFDFDTDFLGYKDCQLDVPVVY